MVDADLYLSYSFFSREQPISRASLDLITSTNPPRRPRNKTDWENYFEATSVTEQPWMMILQREFRSERATWKTLLKKKKKPCPVDLYPLFVL